jgi:hypothetical protein
MQRWIEDSSESKSSKDHSDSEWSHKLWQFKVLH